MADLSAHPCAPASSTPSRRLIAAGYVRRASQPPAAPSDLEVAISVAQQLLDSDQVLSLREALRLLLRALDAEPVDEAEAVRRSVDAQFPAVASFLAQERGASQ
ncbi:hypothetical protein [Streptomyces sp. NRRL S-813]|uniref:hypothetical protein n=1 Tax=Streptomyces sp. NRRL S-813 TaxID=1463919 RepID=UPI0004C18696|nr:hypothetical protein [Streptomyces sp. NRRL S-813]